MRYWYTIINFFKYRKILRQYLIVETLQAATLAAVKIRADIETIILDFDGVLAAHGEIELAADAEVWLHQALARYKPAQIVILSNKPSAKRVACFAAKFPGIEFYKAKKKKPYPDGINVILAARNCAKDKAVIIDDRLATGILAASIAGINGILVTAPKINLTKRPIAEVWFIFLRLLERMTLSLLHKIDAISAR